MKNKIYKYDFLIIGAGLIGCLTALSLLSKKFKVLIIDKGDLSINTIEHLLLTQNQEIF